jgi:hypothetical protein
VTTKLSKAKAARLIDRTDRTLRYWTEKGLLPKELTDADLPRLRQLASYTQTKPHVTPEEPEETHG